MLSTRVKSLQFSFLLPAASWNVLHAIRIYFAISLFMPDLWVIKYLDVERNFIENLTWSEFNEHNGLQGVSGRLNMNFILFVPLLGSRWISRASTYRQAGGCKTQSQLMPVYVYNLEKSFAYLGINRHLVEAFNKLHPRLLSTL